jgi:hypothetical protein
MSGTTPVACQFAPATGFTEEVVGVDERCKNTTFAGTPSARNLACSPAASRSSLIVTVIVPPGSR